MRPAFRKLLRRIGRSVGSVWLTFTVAFLVLAYTPNPNNNATPAARYQPRLPALDVSTAPAFAPADASVVESYLVWLIRVLTWELGTVGGSSSAQIGSVVAETTLFTLVYLLPALATAVALGTLVQLYVVSRLGRRSRLVAGVAIGLVSVPVFAYAALSDSPDLLALFGLGPLDAVGYTTDESPLASQNVRAALRPFVVMCVFLLPLQLRHAGTAVVELVDEPFVKTARVKGAGPWRVGRHIFPHVAARLLATLFTDSFGLLLVGIYVTEWVTGVPGFGTLTIDAVAARLSGVILLVVLLPVVTAVLVNLLQDLYLAFVDPRVDETR